MSDALRLIAGPMAAEIAAIFPKPHAAFTSLPASRMHLLALAITGAPSSAIDIEAIARSRWTEAMRVVATPSPAGLAGILAKASLPLWTSGAYRRLWRLLSCPAASKVLRHLESISERDVHILHELPPQLRSAQVFRQLNRPTEARMLATIFRCDAAANRLARAATRVGSRAGFFGKVSEVLMRTDAFPAGPPSSNPDIQPLANMQDLKRAALTFKNCLMDHADRANCGEVYFYEHKGAEPAIIALRVERSGAVVFEQMRSLRNRTVGVRAIKTIRAAFGKVWHERREQRLQHETVQFALDQLRHIDVDAATKIDLICDEVVACHRTGKSVAADKYLDDDDCQ